MHATARKSSSERQTIQSDTLDFGNRLCQTRWHGFQHNDLATVSHLPILEHLDCSSTTVTTSAFVSVVCHAGA